MRASSSGVVGAARERQLRLGEEASHEVDGALISLSEIEVTSVVIRRRYATSSDH
jgi:hypothetical protein